MVAVLLTIASAVSHDWWALARAVDLSRRRCSASSSRSHSPTRPAWASATSSSPGVLGGLLGYLSWSALIVGAFAGFLLGAVAGAMLLAVGRGGRKTELPFGPFMIVGALLALFFAAPIAHAYLHLVGRA